jgi:hypothetical protein
MVEQQTDHIDAPASHRHVEYVRDVEPAAAKCHALRQSAIDSQHVGLCEIHPRMAVRDMTGRSAKGLEQAPPQNCTNQEHISVTGIQQLP